MLVLGIETSTDVCSVGLATEQGACGKKDIRESRIHSEKILILIKELLISEKLGLNRLDGIAVSGGPGSFTGLRIGMSTAKGLCYSLSKALVVVNTFEAIALSVFASFPEIKRAIIIEDAKQGEFYKAIYENLNGSPIEILSTRVESNLNSMSYTEQDIIVTDKVDFLKTKIEKNISIVNIFEYCRGDVIAELGVSKLKKGELSSLNNAEPLYLKNFKIKDPVLKVS